MMLNLKNYYLTNYKPYTNSCMNLNLVQRYDEKKYWTIKNVSYIYKNRSLQQKC